jgi:hypothetical protein
MYEPFTIRSYEDFVSHIHQVVRVVGEYRQLDLRMDAAPPPQYRGQVEIVVEPRLSFVLESLRKPEGVRSTDEIARFEGHRVVVVGTVEAPEFGEGASMMIPRLVKVQSITLEVK